ncbi:LCP family protein [Paenibacillus sp. 1P07SE]|uniref:LCP family protein n=1 Tax=Paenibacillus sp. 1P07SE TaxID=3132209 RepID=UPI0039A5EB83
MSTYTRDQRSAGLAPRRRRTPAKPPKKKARWGIRIMVALLVLMLAAAGYLTWLVVQTKGALQAIGDETVTEVAPEESVSVKSTTILLLGLDARAQGGGLNTDVIKVVALNPNSKTSTIVSIPRDTKIELDGYRSHKANAYYAIFYNQARSEKGMDADEARAEARRETKLLFSRYFDVPIDYTVVANFDGFTDVVNALGGIDVDVDMDMRYVDNADGTNIDLKAGMQRLDGKEALDYVRYRQSNRGTKQSNDVERNARQTQVIGAIADRLISFSGVTKLGSVIEAVGDNIKSDMHWKEIENLGTTYFRMSGSGIESLALEGTWRSPYVHVDQASLESVSAALKAKLAE